MSRMYLCLLSLSLIALASGCQSCNQCGAGGCCLFRGLQNQTIAPPPAYNMGFGQAGNQPYYNTAQQPKYLINPNATAPTPAGSSPSLAPQNGWRPTSPGQPTQPNAGTQNNTPVSVLASNQTPPPRLASLDPNALVNPNAGNSFRNNVNYQSTSVDERQDGTRIPVTDATGVRAPANVYNTTQPNRIAQAQFGTATYPSYSQPVQGQVPVITVPGQTIVNGQIIGGQPAFYGQPHFYHGQSAYVGNVATYPGQYNGGPVLAQSTANYDPRNNPNFQSGWRDRELTTDN